MPAEDEPVHVLAANCHPPRPVTAAEDAHRRGGAKVHSKDGLGVEVVVVQQDRIVGKADSLAVQQPAQALRRLPQDTDRPGCADKPGRTGIAAAQSDAEFPPIHQLA